MLELHAWITIRETYEAREDEEEGMDLILQKIKNSIESLKWNKPKLKAKNGEWYIESTLYANRRNEEVDEIIQLFDHIAQYATGSYGLIYMLDDADANGKDNEFQVYSISRGKLHEQRDLFLSPFIPIVEDVDDN